MAQAIAVACLTMAMHLILVQAIVVNLQHKKVVLQTAVNLSIR